MPLPPQLQRVIQQLQARGIEIDEDDPEAIMGVLQAMAQAQQPPETVPDKVLSSLDLEGVVQHISEGKAKNIIVMVGAGLSTAAGIPDFRTPGTGLYDNLQKYNLPTPEAIFSIDFFRKDPGAFYELAREMWPGNYAPTKAHYFVRLLEEKKLLLRCYTQNIDSLEELAGVSSDLVVAAHGNFSSAHGIDTGVEVPMQEVREAVMGGKPGWKAMVEKRGELVKPDIVFFGESLPARFMRLIESDFPKCDLLIVMGTSLVVAPFNQCISFVNDSCPRMLVNREPAGLEGTIRKGFRFISKQRNYRDVFYRGDCDAGAEALCAQLGWSQELARVMTAGSKSMGAPPSASQTDDKRGNSSFFNKFGACMSAICKKG